MNSTWHWLAFILVFITLGLFFVTHTDSVTKLMGAGVEDLAGIEKGFGAFATTSPGGA